MNRFLGALAKKIILVRSVEPGVWRRYEEPAVKLGRPILKSERVLRIFPIQKGDGPKLVSHLAPFLESERDTLEFMEHGSGKGEHGIENERLPPHVLVTGETARIAIEHLNTSWHLTV